MFVQNYRSRSSFLTTFGSLGGSIFSTDEVMEGTYPDSSVSLGSDLMRKINAKYISLKLTKFKNLACL